MEQQIISLLFTHLNKTAVEWYAAEVGKVLPMMWDQVVGSFGAALEGCHLSCGQPLSSVPSSLEKSRRLLIISLKSWDSKDLDQQIYDEMKQTWLARGLPQYLKEVVFYAKGIVMVHMEERLKKWEELHAFSLDVTLGVAKETPKKDVPL